MGCIMICMTTTPRPVGDRIADLVRASGVKQAALARRLHLHPVSLSDRLRGRTRWTADELLPLARVLGVHPAELLGDLCTVYRHTDGRLCLQPIDHDGEHFPQEAGRG